MAAEKKINENMTLWNKYATPPAEALKDFDNGNFKGTDISPMWRIRCLTEEFGPCGIGWYTEVVEHWSEVAWSSNIEKCVTTHVRIKLCYVDKQTGEWSKPVEAVGGNTMTVYSRMYKTTRVSDEAYKMAYTDAIGGACKMLGIGGSVYWEHGYSKYEDSYTEPQQTPQQTPQKATQKPSPDLEMPRISIPLLPGESREDVEWRQRAIARWGMTKLDQCAMNVFGKDFMHTPVALLKTKMRA